VSAFAEATARQGRAGRARDRRGSWLGGRERVAAAPLVERATRRRRRRLLRLRSRSHRGKLSPRSLEAKAFRDAKSPTGSAGDGRPSNESS